MKTSWNFELWIDGKYWGCYDTYEEAKADLPIAAPYNEFEIIDVNTPEILPILPKYPTLFGYEKETLHLSHRPSYLAVQQSLNKAISSVQLEDKVLYFTFSDNSKLKIWDEETFGQYKYLDTSDELSEYKDSILLDFELKTAIKLPSTIDEEVHEMSFLDVITNKGVFQICVHNEHNGCYESFLINAQFTN